MIDNLEKRQMENWSPWRAANYSFFVKALAGQARENTLLDVGCGDGQFNVLFDQFKKTGIDFQPYESATVVADITKGLPFADESFDIVTASNTLEHIPNAAFLIEECRRVLKPGGVFIGTIPFLLPVHQAPHDFNRFTNFQLENMLAAFSSRQVIPLGDPFDVLWTARRVFFRRIGRRNVVGQAARIMLYVTLKIAKPFLLSQPSNTFTEGYGFIAVR